MQGTRAPSVGILHHPRSLDHDPGPRHPEGRRRIEAVLAHLRACGLAGRLLWETCEPASRRVLEDVHQPAYLDLLKRLDAAGGGRLDPDTAMSPGSLEASLRAAGGAVEGARRVLEGQWEAAFVLMRPPGHHATPDRAMGFCLHNHAAVAARWALRSGGARRVVIVDWDAHHGNGTQEIFWRDPDVLYASLHQYPWYPGTGAVTETGEGPGAGTTVNVPLPAGAGEDAYRKALEEVLLPAAAAFAPDLVVVSAGYDAHHADPLCMMRLRAGAFFRMARLVAGLGCGLVCVLEGGYDLDGLAWSVGATLSALLGDDEPAGVPDWEVGSLPGSPDALEWVERAASVLRG